MEGAPVGRWGIPEHDRRRDLVGVVRTGDHERASVDDEVALDHRCLRVGPTGEHESAFGPSPHPGDRRAHARKLLEASRPLLPVRHRGRRDRRGIALRGAVANLDGHPVTLPAGQQLHDRAIAARPGRSVEPHGEPRMEALAGERSGGGCLDGGRLLGARRFGLQLHLVIDPPGLPRLRRRCLGFDGRRLDGSRPPRGSARDHGLRVVLDRRVDADPIPQRVLDQRDPAGAPDQIQARELAGSDVCVGERGLERVDGRVDVVLDQLLELEARELHPTLNPWHPQLA